MLKAADAWTLAAAGWAALPMNPKNAPARVTATATAGAAAAAAAATAVPLGAQATAAAPTAAEAATRPVDLDEGDERAIGVLQRLNTAPVMTAAAVAAPGDGGRALACGTTLVLVQRREGRCNTLLLGCFSTDVGVRGPRFSPATG